MAKWRKSKTNCNKHCPLSAYSSLFSHRTLLKQSKSANFLRQQQPNRQQQAIPFVQKNRSEVWSVPCTCQIHWSLILQQSAYSPMGFRSCTERHFSPTLILSRNSSFSFAKCAPPPANGCCTRDGDGIAIDHNKTLVRKCNMQEQSIRFIAAK